MQISNNCGRLIAQPFSALTAAECHIRNHCPQINVEERGSLAEMSPENGVT